MRVLGVLLLLAQTRIAPPPAADSLWHVVGACSGAPVLPGGDLSDVVWMVDSVAVHDRFHGSRAVWSPPDTITFDVGLDYNAYPWVIAHELLHHRMRGPPETVHPLNPFLFPCKLMPIQNRRLP